MPHSTSRQKIEAIARFGGECQFVDSAAEVYAAAARIAAEHGGYYLDQFTHAERATDWRGNNNIADSIFRQMEGEEHPVPEWVIMSAGTGGTAATLGRLYPLSQSAHAALRRRCRGFGLYDAWLNQDPR